MSNGKWSIRKDSISGLWTASYFVAVTSFAADNKTLTITFYDKYWDFIDIINTFQYPTPEYFREVRKGGATLYFYNYSLKTSVRARVRILGIDYY